MRMKELLPRELRGFTLTEAAIVLGIVGLILGAIWVAAASVYNNIRVSTTSNQILQIVQSIRSINATSTTVPGLAGQAGAILVAQANGVPQDMITRVAGAITAVSNVWGGLVEIDSVPNGGVADTAFQITFPGVPQGACTDLIIRNSGQGRDSGLTSVGANGTNYTSAANQFPVTMTNAVAACNVTAAAGNRVQFIFTLRN